MPPPNVLTFDIEGFVEASHDAAHVPDRYIDPESEAREIETNTLEILDTLAEFDQRATFFILGRIARDMPSLVRRIAGAGHEIGCHSFEHRRLFQFGRPDLERVLADAKQHLEHASGHRVRGFRAPDFSIRRSNLWVFDVLRDVGFEYDSSVYPTGLHDVYGIEGFPRSPFQLPNGLVELPMSTMALFGRGVPYGGGGYFRLYPLTVTRALIKRANRHGRPCVVYLHPFEIGKVVIRIEELPLLRRLRTYVGIDSVQKKLRALMREFRFVTAQEYLSSCTMAQMEVSA